MTLTNQILSAREQLQARARDYRHAAVTVARGSALGAAERVAAAKQPVRTLALAGQKLSNLSNRYFEQLFGQQAHTLEGVIEAGVVRLKRAAKAESVRKLVEDQRELGTASRERLAEDLKATWKIARDTGSELRDLAVETYAELVHGVKTSRTAAPKKKAKAKAKTARTRKAR
ncbi:MAG TPA: phasin family protein [Steroidobacteraceae bacterium]|nr:phasin family protein [Steroidobacteraceae bacterium]